MPETLIDRRARNVPRYTSYPTSPNFHAGVDAATFARWLAEVPPAAPLSLYAHIPFCDRLCWFCGCHTRQVARYAPIAAYLESLYCEIDLVAERLGGRGYVAALHLGGGSPSLLEPADLLRLAAEIRARFPVADPLEFSMEIDPNDMTADRLDALALAGVSRVSIGVQDFDPRVQEAINRPQTFEQTRLAVDGARERGVRSVNLDVLYGLPHQTVESVERTIDRVLELAPDRVALFGYAHVPWMKSHQRLIDETALPNSAERLHQSQAAAEKLISAGYDSIGMDHFARPGDALSLAARAGTLHRNFQGYTDETAATLIGLGASAISCMPQGFAQNAVPTGVYAERIASHVLATVRGVALTAADRVRGWVIERLMCDFSIDLREMTRRFGANADAVQREMALVAMRDRDRLVAFSRTTFVITERGRPYVRTIAAEFDEYLRAGTGRHTVAI